MRRYFGNEDMLFIKIVGWSFAGTFAFILTTHLI